MFIKCESVLIYYNLWWIFSFSPDRYTGEKHLKNTFSGRHYFF